MSSKPNGDGPQAPDLERRLAADEERITRDEIRIAADEKRIEQDETWIRRNWILALSLAVISALTIAALIVGIVALNRDIDAAARATPAGGSVDSAALADGAVTAGKLAKGAVTPPALAAQAVTGAALAPGAVGTGALAGAAVTAAKVAPDSLTGAVIKESTLGTVPKATSAGTASDATALAGVAAGRYLSRITVVHATTQTSTLAAKGPVTATCPSGTQVVSGGAAVAGAGDVALTASAPQGTTGWTAQAVALGTASQPWRIDVTAICAHGG